MKGWKVIRRREAIAHLAGACLVVGAGAPRALAGYTEITSSVPLWQNHGWALDNIYQSSVAEYGNFALQDDGVSYSNGDMSIMRMDDFGKGQMTNVFLSQPGSSDDQTWGYPVTNISATAKFSMFGGDQTLGYYAGDSDEFHELLAVSGEGFDASGTATGWNMVGQTWRWVNNAGGDEFSSAMGDNPGDLDHLVTYRVYGGDSGNLSTWLLFWDSDGDGNFLDLVVEITTALASPPAPVPLPPAVLLGAAGLAGIVVLRRRLRP